MKLDAMKQCYHGVQLSDIVCSGFYRTLLNFGIVPPISGNFYVKLACKMRDYAN